MVTWLLKHVLGMKVKDLSAGKLYFVLYTGKIIEHDDDQIL